MVLPVTPPGPLSFKTQGEGGGRGFRINGPPAAPLCLCTCGGGGTLHRHHQQSQRVLAGNVEISAFHGADQEKNGLDS